MIPAPLQLIETEVLLLTYGGCSNDTPRIYRICLARDFEQGRARQTAWVTLKCLPSSTAAAVAEVGSSSNLAAFRIDLVLQPFSPSNP